MIHTSVKFDVFQNRTAHRKKCSWEWKDDWDFLDFPPNRVGALHPGNVNGVNWNLMCFLPR